MWAIAAPASAASIAASAISSGVTGTCGERPAVSPAPVSAQVMKTSDAMATLIANLHDPTGSARLSAFRETGITQSALAFLFVAHFIRKPVPTFRNAL
jgi:hypothetical protein